MLVEPQDPPASAPKWARMPGSVRLKLDQAIANHQRVHGSRFYDLLRDDPQFAPWIGTHLGARGEKRLDRAIREVRRVQSKKMARRVGPVPQAAEAAAGVVGPESTVDLPPEPAEMFVAAGAAVVSYAELQGDLRRRRGQLERMIAACLNELGEAVDPALYLKLSREHRALVTDSANLAKRYHADMQSEHVIRNVLDRVLNEFADDPARAGGLITDLNKIFRETTGIAATGGEHDLPN
jgi:hypothetical protein